MSIQGSGLCAMESISAHIMLRQASTSPNRVCTLFQHYKDLEKGKWVRVLRWAETGEAADLIRAGIERATQDVQREDLGGTALT